MAKYKKVIYTSGHTGLSLSICESTQFIIEINTTHDHSHSLSFFVNHTRWTFILYFFNSVSISSSSMSVNHINISSNLGPVWPDWANFCTLGNRLKPVATIILPKLPTMLSNFWKVAKTIYFSLEMIFGQLLSTIGNFYLVTLLGPLHLAWVITKSNTSSTLSVKLLIFPYFICTPKFPLSLLIMGPLWPDLVILGSFGKILNVLGSFQVNFLFSKILNLLWQILFALGQNVICYLAKYWK